MWKDMQGGIVYWIVLCWFAIPTSHYIFYVLFLSCEIKTSISGKVSQSWGTSTSTGSLVWSIRAFVIPQANCHSLATGSTTGEQAIEEIVFKVSRAKDSTMRGKKIPPDDATSCLSSFFSPLLWKGRWGDYIVVFTAIQYTVWN